MFCLSHVRSIYFLSATHRRQENTIMCRDRLATPGWITQEDPCHKVHSRRKLKLQAYTKYSHFWIYVCLWHFEIKIDKTGFLNAKCARVMYVPYFPMRKLTDYRIYICQLKPIIFRQVFSSIKRKKLIAVCVTLLIDASCATFTRYILHASLFSYCCYRARIVKGVYLGV